LMSHYLWPPKPSNKPVPTTVLWRAEIELDAFVRAIEALSTIQPSGPFERALARLRPIVPAAPSCVGDEILSASEAIRDKRPAPWLTDN
jgi:hypothetical protein